MPKSLAESGTMLLGIDVSHPAAGDSSSEPSIAAVGNVRL